VRLAADPPAHPFVQRLPDNRLLLVGARSAWRPEGPELNASVVNSDGDQVTAAVLGDGILHVQTTLEGDI